MNKLPATRLANRSSAKRGEGWYPLLASTLFKYIFPPATFPTGGQIHHIPIEFTDSVSNVTVVNLEVNVVETNIDTP